MINIEKKSLCSKGKIVLYIIYRHNAMSSIKWVKPLIRFLWNLLQGTIRKSCWACLNFVKIGSVTFLLYVRNLCPYFFTLFSDMDGILYMRIASFVKISAVKGILYFRAWINFCPCFPHFFYRIWNKKFWNVDENLLSVVEFVREITLHEYRETAWHFESTNALAKSMHCVMWYSTCSFFCLVWCTFVF
jgi:hypothetical protein